MSNKFSPLLKKWELPGEKKISIAIESISLTEKLVGVFLITLLSISSLALLLKANRALMVPVPASGGTLTEGIVGSPRFANPVLALTGANADRDIVSLVYSGLLKATPAGDLIPDLAESWEISEDGLRFTFTLKDDLYFHDGTPITAEDIEFTISKIQDPTLRSPRRANWEGVRVEISDPKTMSFVLNQPYAMFPDNATLGILPKHLWSNLSPDQFSFSVLNIEPIGSGPYKIKSLKKDSSGLPTSYHLVAFKNYALGEPFIKNLVLRFYSNEAELIDDFEKGTIESMGAISPEEAGYLKDRGRQIKTSVLPRIFGVFFNQNEASLFTQKEVRSALNESLDKNRLVSEILFGFGQPAESPIPISHKPHANSHTDKNSDKTERAISILENSGWKLPEEGDIRRKETRENNFDLSFSISTGNLPDLIATASILKEEWEKVGASVDIKVFEANSDLSQNVIRPRKYDALLFGINVGRDMDLFPFWHSSQRNDPGFNIALYANITTDKILEEIRTIQEKDRRLEKYEQFEKEVLEDQPAIFLYSPEFIYAVPDKLKNVNLGLISQTSDRFLDIHSWFIETNKVWKIFAK